jgi:hypothetical protein
MGMQNLVRKHFNKCKQDPADGRTKIRVDPPHHAVVAPPQQPKGSAIEKSAAFKSGSSTRPTWAALAAFATGTAIYFLHG